MLPDIAGLKDRNIGRVKRAPHILLMHNHS